MGLSLVLCVLDFSGIAIILWLYPPNFKMRAIKYFRCYSHMTVVFLGTALMYLESQIYYTIAERKLWRYLKNTVCGPHATMLCNCCWTCIMDEETSQL